MNSILQLYMKDALHDHEPKTYHFPDDTGFLL